MFGLIPKPYLFLAFVLLLVGSNIVIGWRFYRTGYAIAEARAASDLAKAQARIMKAADDAARNEEARLKAEADADAKARELEDMAYADPVRPACGIGIDRVRRLQSR